MAVAEYAYLKTDTLRALVVFWVQTRRAGDDDVAIRDEKGRCKEDNAQDSDHADNPRPTLMLIFSSAEVLS